jgi:hypothetical protein
VYAGRDGELDRPQKRVGRRSSPDKRLKACPLVRRGEAALLDALERGHLVGAGLDVFEVEPPRPDNPLVSRDDVIVTPHIASSTGAGRDRIWHTALTQAVQALRGERPPHLVNPEVWPLVERRATAGESTTATG